MKTIYCPACGVKCNCLSKELEQSVSCPNGHGWTLIIDWASSSSKDGTSIVAFQCDGTSAHELPNACDNQTTKQTNKQNDNHRKH